jgi:hypothetical protein
MNVKKLNSFIKLFSNVEIKKNKEFGKNARSPNGKLRITF